VLKDGTRLNGMILKNRKLLKDRQPLVFMNACELGYSTRTLADYGGMAGACLCSGSRGFIAPLWSVDDKIACEIAVDFYNDTIEGKIEVAEVMRRLRSRFDPKADNPEATYLAYTYYGHPKLVLNKSF
jgi:CHAT domain-containing protein